MSGSPLRKQPWPTLHSVSGLPPPLSGPSPTGQRQEPVQSRPQGPGLERWLQSPAHNKLRNQPGAQFCLCGAHATTPGDQMAGRAASSHPAASSPLPLPRPVTSHQVSLGELQSQSLQLRPSPPAVPVGTSVWSHAVDSSVACPPTGLLTSQRHNRCFPSSPRPSACDAPTSGSRLLVDTYACHHHLSLWPCL